MKGVQEIGHKQEMGTPPMGAIIIYCMSLFGAAYLHLNGKQGNLPQYELFPLLRMLVTLII